MSPKRKSPRRNRRPGANERASTPQSEPEPVRPRRDISITGLIGGLTGAVPLGAFAAELLIDPAGESRWWAVPFFLMALVYVPAIWASVARLKDRKRTLRNVLSLSLVLLVLVTIVTRNPSIALLLLIPSSLLAVASGVIFQGPRARQ